MNVRKDSSFTVIGLVSMDVIREHMIKAGIDPLKFEVYVGLNKDEFVIYQNEASSKDWATLNTILLSLQLAEEANKLMKDSILSNTLVILVGLCAIAAIGYSLHSLISFGILELP